MVSRRDFLKSAAVMGTATFLSLHKFDLITALQEVKDYWHICWLNGAGCTGCSVSFAQAADPDLIEILTSITVGTSGLPIALPDWMYVVHPASGALAIEFIKDWIDYPKGQKILVVEGALQKEGFCETGGRDFREWVKEAAQVADYIVAFGSCSAFGGIPHASGNPTGAMGVQDFLREIGRDDLAMKVINLPRCPGHPDSLTLTLASLMLGVVPELDEHNRPLAFYGKNIHSEHCPFRPFFERLEFSEFGQSESGCRFKIGCKGPIAWADCSSRKWNNRTAFCIDVGAPCIACSEPEFPDGMTAPFFAELPEVAVTIPPAITARPVETPPPTISVETLRNVGIVGIAIVAAGAAAAIYASRRKKKESSETKIEKEV